MSDRTKYTLVRKTKYSSNKIPNKRKRKLKESSESSPKPRQKGMSKLERALMQSGLVPHGESEDIVMDFINSNWDLASQLIELANAPQRQGATMSIENESFDRADELIESLRNMSTDTTRNIQYIVNRLTERLDDITDKTIKVEHGLANPFPKLIELMKEHKQVLCVVAIIVLGYWAMNYGGQHTILFRTAIGIGMMLVGYAGELHEWLSKIFTCVMDKIKPTVTRQSGFVETVFPRLALVGIFTSIFKNIKYTTAEDICEQFGKRCINLKKMNEGIQYSVTAIMDLIQEFLNLITDKLQWKRIAIKSDPFWEVGIYLESVRDRIKSYAEDPLRDSTFAADLVALKAEGESLRNRVHPIPSSQPQILLITEALQSIRKILDELQSRLISIAGQRPEPMFLCITGPPGVGKTSFVNQFWATITAQTLPLDKLQHFNDNKGAYIHTYNQNDDFYSGYNGQYNLMVDEFGFLKDMPGAATVWAEFIQWVNVNPMNLNMADLHRKGNTYFRSKFIWSTSNRAHFNDINSVQEKQAVYRRMENTFVATPAPKYCTDDTIANTNPWQRRTDWNKVNAAGKGRDYSYLEFYKMLDLEAGTYTSEPISYEQLNDYVVNKSMEKNILDAEQIEATNERVSDIIRKRLAKQQSGDSCVACPACVGMVHRKNNGVQALLNLLQIKGDEFIICGDKMDRIKFEEMLSLHYSFPLEVEGYTGCIWSATRTFDFFHSLIYNLDKNFIMHANISEESINKNSLWKHVKTGIKYCSFFLIGFGAIKFLITALGWIRNMFVGDNVEAQSENYNLKQRRINPKAKNFKHKFALPQSGDDPNAANIAVKLANRNIWRWKVNKTPGQEPVTTNQGCVLLLQNNLVIMPQHYIDQWSEIIGSDDPTIQDDIPRYPDATITFYNCRYKNKTNEDQITRSVTLSLKDILPLWHDEYQMKYGMLHQITEHEDDDIGIFYIPGLTGPNILKLFRSKNDPMPLNHRGILATVNRDISTVFHTGQYKLTRNETYQDKTWACKEGIIYDIPTRVGDCGSPFILMDKRNEAKIAAIHVGGIGNTQGLGIMVNREGIQSALSFALAMNDLLRDVGEDSAHPDCKPLIQSGVVIEAGKPVVECKAKMIPQIRRTKIIPSPIHDKIRGHPPKEKPAMLGKHGSIDPMEMAKWGYGTSYCRPHKDLHRAAAAMARKMFFSSTVKLEDDFKRPLTFEEAVMGLPGEEFLDSINRKTSPGWPMKHLLTNGSKKSAFGEEEFSFDNKECELVKDHVRHLEECILRGDRPFVLNNHFLKDETRPIEKADIGKTRLISSSDLVFNIAMRKYTLMFSSYMMRSRIQNGSAIGVNPFGADWDILAQHLGGGAENWRMIAGDISGFDKILSPEEFWSFKILLNEFYNDDVDSHSYKIRNALIDELAQSRHLCGDEVYSWMGGNSSGNGLTTPINTVSLITLILYVILLQHPEQPRNYNHGWRILTEVMEYIRLIVYGDDHIIAVQTKSPYNWLTAEVIRRGFGDLNIKYTNEAKSEVFDDRDRTLEEVTFLKRGFERYRFGQRRWLAPLSLDTIFESIQWTKDHDIGYEFWQNNVTNMLKELSAHVDVYEEYERVIRKVCAENGYHITAMNHRDALSAYVGSEYCY